MYYCCHFAKLYCASVVSYIFLPQADNFISSDDTYPGIINYANLVQEVFGECFFSFYLISDRAIPSSNIDLHFAHCSRNLERCKVCGDMVPKKRAEEHFLNTHAPVCEFFVLLVNFKETALTIIELLKCNIGHPFLSV